MVRVRPPAAFRSRAQAAFADPVSVDVRIDHVGAQGDGVAPGPLFVPLTLPGELVLVRAGGERAELQTVLTPSPERTEPPCPHFGTCGGCALQHWSSAPYLAWKVDQIRLALGREGLETELLRPYAAPPASRRRLALHARRSAGTVRLGYKSRRSWTVVEIDVCVIADPRLVAALPQLRAFAKPLFEHPKSAPTLHATWTETGLDVDVTGVEARSGGLSADARLKAAQAAADGNFARATLAGETLYLARAPIVNFGPARVSLPAGGFLQAVEAAERAMTGFTTEGLAGAQRIADLFCGSGAFSFNLAQQAPVLALDAAAGPIAALRSAQATAPGLKSIDAEARDLDRRPLLAAEMKRIDAVLFDPPRAGALAQSQEIARSKVERVVGVSCNPASFARDARILADGGFRLMRVLPVDQFLWSPHIELAGYFER